MAESARDLALPAGALVLATALAELLGAANMGTALTFGTLAFTAALLWTLLRADGAADPSDEGPEARQPR